MAAPKQAAKGQRVKVRYASREEQLLELLEVIRRSNHRVYKAMVVLFDAEVSASVVEAFGTIVTFIAEEARREGPRGAR